MRAGNNGRRLSPAGGYRTMIGSRAIHFHIGHAIGQQAPTRVYTTAPIGMIRPILAENIVGRYVGGLVYKGS